jgi:hypothetical protein
MNLPPIGVEPPRSKYRYAAALFAFLGIVPSACVYDASDRCGPNQVMYEDLRCVCDEFSVPTATGCERCASDEVPGPMGCACKEPGYVKPAAGGVCEAPPPPPMGLGAACDATTPCADPGFTHCEAGADGSGYCTKTDCAAPEDCTDGYACDLSVTPSVCRRPPAGLGMSCTADADCAGTEATYCDTFQSHSCLVQGCSVAPDNCFTGWDCCDLKAFGVPQPICIPEGACTQ